MHLLSEDKQIDLSVNEQTVVNRAKEGRDRARTIGRGGVERESVFQQSICIPAKTFTIWPPVIIK